MKGRRPTVHHRIARRAIQADSVYPVSTFLRRLGLGRHSLNAMRRQGLPVRSIGRRTFIDGGEAVAFLRRLWAGELETRGRLGGRALAGTTGSSNSLVCEDGSGHVPSPRCPSSNFQEVIHDE